MAITIVSNEEFRETFTPILEAHLSKRALGFFAVFNHDRSNVMICDLETQFRNWHRSGVSLEEFSEWCDLQGVNQVRCAATSNTIVQAKTDNEKMLLKLRWC